MIADNKEIKKRITELQAKLNIIFPQLYIDFLAKINDGDVYEVYLIAAEDTRNSKIGRAHV